MSDSTARPQMRFKERLETLCVEMIDKGILFSEAMEHFEICFIKEALRRNGHSLIRTASSLGIHRNTLSKRVNNKKFRQQLC